MQSLFARVGFQVSGVIDNLEPEDPEVIYYIRKLRWLWERIGSPPVVLTHRLGPSLESKAWFGPVAWRNCPAT